MYLVASEFCLAVSALLRTPAMCRNRQHCQQIAEASDSIVANLEEGFEQGTDRAFARYLFIAKGSASEVAGHLRRAAARGYARHEELDPLIERAELIARMLAGFIRYLRACDWKDRGLHGRD